MKLVKLNYDKGLLVEDHEIGKIVEALTKGKQVGCDWDGHCYYMDEELKISTMPHSKIFNSYDEMRAHKEELQREKDAREAEEAANQEPVNADTE